jgi:SAM-dependent methyltransferase
MTDWDRMFDELYLRAYAARQPPEEAEAQAEAVARLVGLEPAADVLDCPCGYGRHSVPLARAGHRVVGADRSEALLAEARRRGGGEWPKWVHADYRELPFPDASFDCALNLFSSLGYWGEEGDEKALAEFRRVLRPGGALVVETMHRDRLIARFLPESWEELPGDGLLLERRSFDPAEGMVETELTLIEADGGRRSIAYRLRTYTATELARLARVAGFGELDLYGDLEGAPFAVDSRLVLVAR